MSDAFKRFFDITELIDHLTLFLDTKDVSRLLRTNKTIYARCAPSLFRTLSDTSLKELLSSMSALQVLARNSQHVRRLTFTSSQLAYYYNCVLAFQDICSHISDTPSTRPLWFPPLDVHTYQLVALPPMTRLSHIDVNIDETFMVAPSQTALAHLCWIPSLSPHLTSLTLQVVPIAGIESCRRLGEAIAGLHALKKLDLTVFCRDNIKLALLYQLFLGCSSSVRLLNLHMIQHEDFVGEEDERGDTAAVARRLEPLINLEELSVMGAYEWNSAADIGSIFACCPNIKRLSLVVSTEYQVNESIEQFIGRQCPKIELLSYRRWSTTPDPFPFRIMESLPAQQVTGFEYVGALPKVTDFKTDVAFQRHSTTLRKICIDGKGTVTKVMASVILNGCFNLETLFIARESSDPHIALADAIEYPWACTKLQQLSLAISGCELPVEPGVKPYYSRPTPITLTEVETQHFSRLEDLYQRIAALTELRELYLTMVLLGEDGEGDDGTMLYSRRSFPAMLNLQDGQTGRPGFLQLLSELKKLEKLEGSVSVESDETKVTVGRTEAIWMDQNWPDLQHTDFFMDDVHVTEPFRWLEDKRKSEGRVLKTSAFF